jgi:hypothetical protein
MLQYMQPQRAAHELRAAEMLQVYWQWVLSRDELMCRLLCHLWRPVTDCFALL